MIIKEIKTDKDFQKYSILSEQYGTIFSSLDWIKLFEESVQLYGIYNKGSDLIGGFNLMKKTKKGLKIYTQPPFTPFIGPVIKYSSNKYHTHLSLQKEIMSDLVNFCDGLNYHVINFALNQEIIDTMPFLWKKYNVKPIYTYVVNLENSIDDLWNNMSNERRNDIRKGEKDGLRVKKIEDYDISRQLIFKTYQRQNKNVDILYLDKILFKFANNANSFCITTYKDDIPISMVFCIYDNNCAYYILGGYDNGNKHHGAGPMAVWEAIKYSKILRLKQFDFEGSIIPQIERYFRGFGGALVPYYFVNKAVFPIDLYLKYIKGRSF